MPVSSSTSRTESPTRTIRVLPESAEVIWNWAGGAPRGVGFVVVVGFGIVTTAPEPVAGVGAGDVVAVPRGDVVAVVDVSRTGADPPAAVLGGAVLGGAVLTDLVLTDLVDAVQPASVAAAMAAATPRTRLAITSL